MAIIRNSQLIKSNDVRRRKYRLITSIIVLGFALLIFFSVAGIAYAISKTEKRVWPSDPELRFNKNTYENNN